MTRDKVTLAEAIAWFVTGLLIMFAVAKFAIDYR